MTNTYKLSGVILTMKYGKRGIDTTVETDMALNNKVTVDQLVKLGIAPEGTTDDNSMCDVTAIALHMVEVIDWNQAKKLDDVVAYIKSNHPELITVANVTRQGGGSTLTIYKRFNLVKNSKTGEIDSIQFTPTGKNEVNGDLVANWIATGRVSKPALVAKLKEIYGV